MATVFVSFDWHNDRAYRHMLQAWHANPRFEFTFDDGTPDEIDSVDVGPIKGALTNKIKAATHTLVIVGAHVNDRHRNANLIGFKNWIHFEIARSLEEHNRIVAVRLERSYALPEVLVNQRYTLVEGFTENGVIDGLGRA